MESKRVVESKNYSLPKPIVIQRAKTKAKKLRKVGEEDDRFQFEYKISLGKLNISIDKTCIRVLTVIFVIASFIMKKVYVAI